MRYFEIINERSGSQEIRDFSDKFDDPKINKHVFAQAARRNPAWKRSLVASMKKHGFELVGAGINGAVFRKPNYRFVIKIYRTDQGFDEWVHFCLTNKGNKFVPNIKGSPVRLNNTFTAIRIESLEPCPDDKAIEFCEKMDKIESALWKDKEAVAGDPELAKVSKFVSEWGPHSDLSPHNLMCRSDGQVVVVDPIYIDPNYKGDW